MDLGPITVPLPVDFCSLTYDGCSGASPACSELKAGGEVRLCSSLTVPSQSPDVRQPALASRYLSWLSSVPGQCWGHLESPAGGWLQRWVRANLRHWGAEIPRKISSGLHQDPSKSPGPQGIELDRTTQIFYCCFKYCKTDRNIKCKRKTSHSWKNSYRLTRSTLWDLSWILMDLMTTIS